MRQRQSLDKGRPETNPEFNQRVQSQMDRDSWQGCDSVGASYPERAEIHEIEPMGGKPRIYREKK